MTRPRICVRRRAHVRPRGSPIDPSRTSVRRRACARARGSAPRSRPRAVLPAGLDLSRIVVEPPRDASHGDMATNAAMVLAKDAGMKPRDLAETIAAKLRADPTDRQGRGRRAGLHQPHAQAAGLGGRAARRSCAQGADYGRSGDRRRASKVNVEYVSANPTGPMHVGHCRGAVFGDALANLLAFAGYDVTREYYINDAGAQVDVLARSAFLRYREALGEDIGAIPEGLYPGDYLKPVGAGARGANTATSCKAMPEAEWLPLVRAKAIAMMMDDDPRRSRRAQHQARRVLLRALADRDGSDQVARDDRVPARRRATSTKAACRRRRARRSRTRRTASRRCSAPPPSATTSTAR